MLTTPERGRRLAFAQISLAATAAIASWALAPDLDSSKQHEAFRPFFTASAGVIASLLVALAVEARFAVQHGLLASTSAICIGVGEVGAIAALIPTLPDAAYAWLFACTVGGGVGAMTAAVVIGFQVLMAESQATAIRELEALLERSRRDAQR